MPTISYHSDQDSLFHPDLQPTLFTTQGSPDNIQLGIECARLAYIKAELGGSELAKLTAALAAVGFVRPAIFSDAATGARGYGAVRDDGKALLAFRGTQIDQIKDMLTDIAAVPTPWTEAGGNVHYGFARAMRSVVDQVRRWMQLESIQPAQLLVCGHSLGAALATLAASAFRPGMMVTIGSPRVGDAAFAQGIQPTLAVRIVDCSDVVAHLPPEGPHYTHVGDLWYIDRNGVVAHAPADSTMTADQFRGRLDYGLTGLRPGAAPSRDLADHAPINYARAFF